MPLTGYKHITPVYLNWDKNAVTILEDRDNLSIHTYFFAQGFSLQITSTRAMWFASVLYKTNQIYRWKSS